MKTVTMTLLAAVPTALCGRIMCSAAMIVPPITGMGPATDMLRQATDTTTDRVLELVSARWAFAFTELEI